MDRLAFVDVETNGLSPALDRILEIGVVTVDGTRVERWTTPLRGGASPRLQAEEWQDAPRFADIAASLAERLAGHLVVAHNARFDYTFLRAEFERAGIAFEADVLCSLMLARKLYPRRAHHDLDALAACHGLDCETRHRALPDADLLWRWWQAMRSEHDEAVVEAAVAELLAGPVLPAHLDPRLIDRLPEAPGAFVFRDEGCRPLMAGAAANLRLHVVNYFKAGAATARALDFSHRVGDIGWRRTRGMLGARLHAALLARVHRLPGEPATWRFAPESAPCLDVVPRTHWRGESFGLFASERKARNALSRVARRRGLCHALLGLDTAACPACDSIARCGAAAGRKQQLLRVFDTIRPLRIEAWPFAGPVALRERADLHVVDDWQFLGTARNENDVSDLLAARRDGFDPRTYKVLVHELPRLPRERIVLL
jgi:DNA polymerase-3 subunit epsilon